MPIPTLSTVKQFIDRHQAFAEGGLRHQIFHAEENGLSTSGALLRNGRRILIDEEKFFDWIKLQNDQSINKG